ncbi:high-affinity nitrate transporter 2.3-like [Phragmites australis]|uniref:high-affinity nitrate transporter 2.3-like n=1 Tax=Phragmites australis TaxID=29695 RepID=UPI002D7A39E1|nr:high-affinity nitrate transporter 2.3-like [Phragmites australis]
MAEEFKTAAIEVEGAVPASKTRFRMPVDSDNKATEFWLFSFSRPHMSAFHMAWFSFFCCFVSTFAAPPLLPLIRDTLGLTATDIGNAGIASVSGAVFARLAMGTACDLVGPRLASAAIILLTTPAVYCSAIMNSASSFLLARFFTGISLASFVSTQFWMSSMFSSNKVGLANGYAGGWGNLGGGVVQMLMPLVYEAILKIGSTPFTAWRVAFFIPGLMQAFSAIAVLAFGQDMPDGNYRKLHKTGEMHRASFGSVLRHAVGNYRGWILALTYGYSFGVELTVNNIVAQYFFDRFGVNLRTAGLIAASFGMVNLFSRPFGGSLSDWLSSRYGMRGRLWGLWIIQTIEGVLCIVLGVVSSSYATSVAIMILFSLFVQAAEGLTFGVVPFVSRRSLGLVNGMTGGGGSVGAVLTQLIFFHGSKYTTQTGIMYMGFMIIACTLPVALIYFPQWGGMLAGPRPGATAEDYYNGEWTAQEREKGFNTASERFAENSVREGGRRSASGIQPTHTVPV